MSAHDYTPVSMRRAVSTDAPALSAIAFRSKRSNGYSDTFMRACREELAVSIEDLTADEYWIAGGEQTLGFAALRRTEYPGVGEVHAFFVDPDQQRAGVGRQLWETLVEQARSQGMKELRLDADPSAVPFYRRMGLKTIGENPSGSIAGRMLPRMAALLSD